MDTVDRVEEYNEEGNPIVTIKSDKYKSPFRIQKTEDGFVFFEIKLVTGGKTPKQLETLFTTLGEAEKAVMQFINGAKETVTARRDRVYKENHGSKNSSGSE